MKLLFFLFLLTFSINTFSQDFINKTRSEVKVLLQKYVMKNRVNVDYNEYDSLITFNIRDSLRKKADFIYLFDNDGRCKTEIKIACEECTQKFLKEALKTKRYKWTSENDSTYLSNQAGGIRMEKFKQDTSYLLRIMKVQ